MAKLHQGEKMPDFSCDTVFQKNVTLSQLVGEKKTIVLFLRYYGCTLCQYEVHQLKEHYAAIEAVGAQAIVVFQSDPEKIARQITPEDLPFKIICDPEMKLYQRFEIGAAVSREELMTDPLKEKLKEIVAQGFVHGEHEGEEYQLPAYAVVDKELNILRVHYASDLLDMPEAEELPAIFQM